MPHQTFINWNPNPSLLSNALGVEEARLVYLSRSALNMWKSEPQQRWVKMHTSVDLNYWLELELSLSLTHASIISLLVSYVGKCKDLFMLTEWSWGYWWVITSMTLQLCSKNVFSLDFLVVSPTLMQALLRHKLTNGRWVMKAVWRKNLNLLKEIIKLQKCSQTWQKERKKTASPWVLHKRNM